MDRHVMGFFIDYELERFVLIDKGHSLGKLGNPLKCCGIGGKIKYNSVQIIPGAHRDEFPHEAMVREFQEETGYFVAQKRWSCFNIKEYHRLHKIYMFAAFGSSSELEKCRGYKTDEGVIALHTLVDVLFDPQLYTFDLPYILAMIFREMRAGFFMKLDPEGVNSNAKTS